MEDRTLVAGPYIGEFGWEILTWGPIIRALSLRKPYDKVIIYTQNGAEGKNLLYPFANEVRQCDGLGNHESECLGWRDFKDHMEELNTWTQQMVADIREETKDNADVFTLARLQPLNDPHYGAGMPGLLRVPSTAPADEKPTAVLCIRDRALSDFRNWDQEDWIELAEALIKAGHNVIFVGQTRKSWDEAIPDGCDNRLGKTTVDDLIHLFSCENVLAIGGSTGTLHLASQCGCPHLVWGGEKNVMRYAETNWFATPHKVYEWGWDAETGEVVMAVNHYFETRSFL